MSHSLPPSRITTLRSRPLLGEFGSYRVHVGAGVIEKIDHLFKDLPFRHAVLISDRALHAPRERLRAALLRAGWRVDEICVSAGERLKDFRVLFPLYGKLLELGTRRDSVLFALGGGTVGDAVGFLASTYLRGIPWVGVPTTLLAQVDSAVGGKTGVNHPLGKNLIGSIYQPIRVLCDTTVLESLARREMISGFGEMIKYGLVFDPSFFQFLQKNQDALLAFHAQVLKQAILCSLRWKIHVIASDVFDQNGKRQALNFGHTYGHALEKFTEYKVFQHGEAVLLGMRFALALSVVRGGISEEERIKADVFLLSLVSPRLLRIAQKFRVKDFLKHSQTDKKVKSGRLEFVLLQRLGKPMNVAGVTPHEIQFAFERMQSRSGSE